MPFKERSMDLLDGRHYFNDKFSFYAPCAVMNAVINVEKLLEDHHVKPFTSAPFLIFLVTVSFAYSRHKSIMYFIEKSRYSRLHFLWHWFDEQTKIEKKLRLPVRLWFQRPLWYTYRELKEDRSGEKKDKKEDRAARTIQQLPGYQFLGWPSIFYVSKKKIGTLKRLSTCICCLTMVSMCITATQVLVLEPQTFASGLMADTFLEFDLWNFTNTGKVEYCGRKDRLDEVSVQSVVEQAALFMLKEMKYAGANIISRMCMIVVVLACMVSLLYSRSVTFASGLDRPRFASRPYDRQFKCGRTKEPFDQRGRGLAPPAAATKGPAAATDAAKGPAAESNEATPEVKDKDNSKIKPVESTQATTETKDNDNTKSKAVESKEATAGAKDKDNKTTGKDDTKSKEPPEVKAKVKRRWDIIRHREMYFDIDQFIDDGMKVQLTDGTDNSKPMIVEAKKETKPADVGKKNEAKRQAASGTAEKPKEDKETPEAPKPQVKKYRMPGDFLPAEEKEIAFPVTHLMAYYMHFLYPCFIGTVIAINSLYDTFAFRKSILFMGE